MKVDVMASNVQVHISCLVTRWLMTFDTVSTREEVMNLLKYEGFGEEEARQTIDNMVRMKLLCSVPNGTLVLLMPGA